MAASEGKLKMSPVNARKSASCSFAFCNVRSKLWTQVISSPVSKCLLIFSKKLF
jgi:hypothetical protein